jgi:predicted nucleic acid-binding protein
MLGSPSVKVKYLDASALIKLVVDEEDAHLIRDFFRRNTNFCTTSLCLAEALGRLKGLWKKGRKEGVKLSTDQYFKATRELIIETWGGRIEVDELKLLDPMIHTDVESLAKKYNVDLSDALQLVTIKKGQYSVFVSDSASILITADGPLADAAKSEGIRVWNCTKEPVPPWA